MAAGETDHHIAQLVEAGWDVAISHGNGPQVGFILRRSEFARHELHEVPLDVCGADTQGAIGYTLQQNLINDFRAMGLDKRSPPSSPRSKSAPTIPPCSSPSKPIGSFIDEAEAKSDGATRKAGTSSRTPAAAGAGSWPPRSPSGSSRSTPSAPCMDAGVVVITVGGGGIPVVADADGDLTGSPRSSTRIWPRPCSPTSSNADLLLISTAVEKVALRFGTPNRSGSTG